MASTTTLAVLSYVIINLTDFLSVGIYTAVFYLLKY